MSKQTQHDSRPACEIDWTYSMAVCRREQARALSALWSDVKGWFANQVGGHVAAARESRAAG